MVRSTLHQKQSLNVFSSVKYRVTRAINSNTASYPVLKIEGMVLQFTAALILRE